MSALSFLALAAVAFTQHVFSLDYTLQAWVQGGRHPALESPMRALTLLGSGWVLAALSALGYLVLRRAGHPLARPLPAVVVGAFLLNVVTKWLVSRPRPRGTEYGFPSGHALGAAIFFGGVIYALWTSGLPRAWRWAGTVLACLVVLGIAGSRLYLKVHWASDVAGGLTGGAAYILFVLIALARPRRSAST
jgi:membrane-associated phospholipid phosphatase